MTDIRGTVLVVDDDRHITRGSCLRLKSRGFATAEAHSGEAAVEYLSASTPDLVLLDIRMPGMNGLEVLRWIKARKELQHVPVVMMSASLVYTDEALECGAARYLSKPCDSKTLLAAVEEVLAESRSESAAPQLVAAGGSHE